MTQYWREIADNLSMVVWKCMPYESTETSYISLHGRAQGQRNIGRQWKRWMDLIRSDCSDRNTSLV